MNAPGSAVSRTRSNVSRMMNTFGCRRSAATRVRFGSSQIVGFVVAARRHVEVTLAIEAEQAVEPRAIEVDELRGEVRARRVHHPAGIANARARD